MLPDLIKQRDRSHFLNYYLVPEIVLSFVEEEEKMTNKWQRVTQLLQKRISVAGILYVTPRLMSFWAQSRRLNVR